MPQATPKGPYPEDDWWTSQMGKYMCKCGEERGVHTITDGRGINNYCTVCSHDWWIEGPHEWRPRR